MGACLSTKKTPPPSATTVPRNPSSVLSTFSVALSSTAQASTVVVPVPDPKPETKPRKQQQQKPVEEHESAAPTKKEVFLIKHRKSHDERDRNAKQSLSLSSSSNPDPASEHDEHSEVAVPAVASSAQIRTSSCTKEEVDAILIQCGRLSRSSSGKAASSSAGRRYSGSKRSFDFDSAAADGEAPAAEEEKRVRERRRHSPSPQGRRRRTPSRERERESGDHHSQRSSSRERRVSRSPGRRNAADPSPPESAVAVARPGKMVSVPALSAEKSGGETAAVKRVLVKRNAASPRAQSPAKAKPNEPLILSRSSSRKAEISPFRRNPLSEIDSNRSQSRGRRESEGPNDDAAQVVQKPNSVTSHRSNKQQQQQPAATVETTVVIDTKPQSLTRTRSARRSRDFDFNSEATNATPSYTRLLLEDINNFHQKNAPVTLPACVGKACSILEAVADLNNNSNSGSSSTFSEDQYSKTYNNLGGPKDPFVESEIGCDDLTEPSFHKYVTVRRGGTAADVSEDQESSGSNSFVAGGSNGQLSSGNWGLSPSSWEPNSADSTDCLTSRSREDDRLCGGAKKRESYGSAAGAGIGRGRLGAAKGLYPSPVVVADSTR